MTKERNNLHRLMQKKKDGTANTVFFICASYLLKYLSSHLQA